MVFFGEGFAIFDSMSSRIQVLTGGPYHPVTAQFSSLGREFGFHDGVEAFDHLEDCDLLIVGGLHWTGSAPDRHVWPEGVTPGRYRRPTEKQKEAYRAYVESGRPLLGFHGGIASYDDWPEFGTLLGFRWDWQVTAHSPVAEWDVRVRPTGHAVVQGVADYRLWDELYYNVQITPGMDFAVHAEAAYHDIRFPMILTAEGGRIAGAGKTAYLANGHDGRAFECGDFRRVINNTIDWLLL